MLAVDLNLQKAAKNVLKKNVGEKNVMKIFRACIVLAKKSIPLNKKSPTPPPRVIPILKSGEVLLRIPVFASLSSLDSLLLMVLLMLLKWLPN